MHIHPYRYYNIFNPLLGTHSFSLIVPCRALTRFHSFSLIALAGHSHKGLNLQVMFYTEAVTSKVQGTHSISCIAPRRTLTRFHSLPLQGIQGHSRNDLNLQGLFCAGAVPSKGLSWSNSSRPKQIRCRKEETSSA